MAIQQLVTKVFGSRFQRELKHMRPIVARVHEHEARLKDLSRRRHPGPDGPVPGAHPRANRQPRRRGAAAARRQARLRRPRRARRARPRAARGRARAPEGHRRGPRRAAARGVRDGPRGVPPAAGQQRAGDRTRACLGHGALRRPAHRRHRAAPGEDRRNGDRRRQDAGGDAAHLPQCAARDGRPPRHGQQLPGAPRLPVDGPSLPVARAHRRLHRRYRAGLARTPRRLPVRRHLRDQQRVRLRLPARQHGVLARAAGPAHARLRHHRRGGLDPHRRGAARR